ncbi:TPA: xanthine dehydrogenase family protein molybdopterin-binding subunit [Candidatus Poribacteria bacterium]|nr:xanthine dehydrogenase family protein molybdopterin-binding subunit [Candidatus Poribacteria bacterium]HIA64485.1 xanthine dehydrogenase family protein molybdopterin-binding subunit [Candidatus Poribacteria bacterium]HIB86791.1 xanthine dehydrogenase family protein molybdopterin-binding subunit [Candidatus Poribacteria bacterium]HIC01863.1 xanthine dehydrogenase family protein molybdopterin-binding subunit [Candidatus Poribacteria bacterium]HIN32288.1 xanthine dehydrogenase family protein mo
MSNDKEYKVIGTRPIRHDGVDKVTGRALYGADFTMAGLLHGKILRSPHAHARIKSIDTSKAEAHVGVKAAVTAADMPEADEGVVVLGEGGAIDIKFLQDNILASDKALYKGHAVAAVAATNPHTAEEAIDLIEIDYEILPPVMDVRKAMADGAPLLHEDLKTTSLGKTSEKASNVAKHLQFQQGDIEKGFAEADEVVEREFKTATVHQGYIEPHNATALYKSDGHLTIWCSTQGAFEVRDQLEKILQMPVSDIKVVPMEIGGGFGGKIPVYLEPVAALLSMKTSQPVKILMDRAEVFESTGPTAGSYITVKMGINKDGDITAAKAELIYEAGAYPGALVDCGAQCIFSPYSIDNFLVDGYDVVLNIPKTAPYRAPGATNAAMAETVVDELCEKLGMDPLEFRIKNGAREGTRRVDGPIFPRIGHIETVEAARAYEHYNTPLAGKYRGRGVASGFWFNIGLKSSVSLNVNSDGTVNLIEGSTDIGGTRTSIAMQAAEVLGISAEDINPSVVDTDSVGYTGVTGGSRTTFATGYAAIEAANDVVRQMKTFAANLWEVDENEVTFDSGTFRNINGKVHEVPFKDLASIISDEGTPIVGRGAVDPKGVGGAFATHIVDVEVDPETGKVGILRYTAVQDVGKAIHPSYVEGQIHGGAVQGIGWALNEEYIYNDEGRMTNSSFLDYRMPTSYDVPMIEVVIVEVPNPGHPYGVRGVGEVPIVPPAAAIANAIYDAIGIRMTELPMSPDRILAAMGKI